IETLLLGLDLLYQLVARFLIQLVLLGIELLLEAVDFVSQSLQFVLRGLKLLGEDVEIAPAFVGGEDRLFDVDGADFGTRSLSRRGSRGGSVGSSRGGSAGSRVGLGQSEDGEAEDYGHGDARKLANQELASH